MRADFSVAVQSADRSASGWPAALRWKRTRPEAVLEVRAQRTRLCFHWRRKIWLTRVPGGEVSAGSCSCGERLNPHSEGWDMARVIVTYTGRVLKHGSGYSCVMVGRPCYDPFTPEILISVSGLVQISMFLRNVSEILPVFTALHPFIVTDVRI
jgi:hypothetical protein